MALQSFTLSSSYPVSNLRQTLQDNPDIIQQSVNNLAVSNPAVFSSRIVSELPTSAEVDQLVYYRPPGQTAIDLYWFNGSTWAPI